MTPSSRLSVPRLILCLTLAAVAPACSRSAPARGVASAERTDLPRAAAGGGRRPASDRELASYADRERQSRGLEKFEGGRGGSIELTTLLIIVLIVLIIVIIV